MRLHETKGARSMQSHPQERLDLRPEPSPMAVIGAILGQGLKFTGNFRHFLLADIRTNIDECDLTIRENTEGVEPQRKKVDSLWGLRQKNTP